MECNYTGIAINPDVIAGINRDLHIHANNRGEMLG